MLVESPQEKLNSKPEIIDYYVKTLENVLGSEEDAKMSIYDASTTKNLGFCCFIEPKSAHELARLPGVLAVWSDADFNSAKDYSYSEVQFNEPSSSSNRNFLLFPLGATKRWTVRVYKPPASIVTKAQVVDYYVQILTEVLRNEQDAQMCIYDITWESSYGFCCELDDKCAQELAGISGVLSVHPDESFESGNKEKSFTDSNLQESSPRNQAINIKTKKLFITGLSFYTSEKTLREAFESFGEIIEVKIIMDKISKRSKGYAFIEYTTEEAASTALKEMNGKIINGWMITVDVAKKKTPPKHSNGPP